MANPKPNELYSSWAASQLELKKLYSDGLQQYWDWLGDSFYPNLPFIGTENFGQAKAADLPANATPEEVKYYLAAKDLATKLNYLNTEIFDKERPPGGSLAEGNWPAPSSEYDYYKAEVVPAFVLIIENLKVIQENVLISSPNGFNNAFGSGPFAFGQSPPENLPTLIQNVFNTAEEFLAMFPDVGISLQKDIPGAAVSDSLGPAPIASDPDLEASLTFPPGSSATHYIGLLAPPSKTKTEKRDEFNRVIHDRKKPYLPVRLSPHSEKLLKPGWRDPNYSLVRYPSPAVVTSAYKNLVKPEDKDSNGIEIPLGLEITVAEIVPTETGIWVGFVSDDARLNDQITDGQKRLLYTKAQYVRIKESAASSSPDPYISEKSRLFGAASQGEAAAYLEEIQQADLPGTAPVLPGQNWTKLDPNEVALNYYSFNEHNLTVIGKGDENKLIYNTDTLEKFPTLKYSEGMFYFIVSDGVRKTEAELIANGEAGIEESPDDLEAAKRVESQSSFEVIKQEAWNNLLNYLGKNTEGGNSTLYQQLYNKYFILADKKINTNSTNPNNQKMLFAIRACYIDPLPENRRALAENFEPGTPFLGGHDYSVSLKANEVQSRVQSLINDLNQVKQQITQASPGLVIENADGSDFDIDAQIAALEELPDVLNDFFLRQAPQGSNTNSSFIHDMAAEGINTSNNNLVQIGVKDNKEIGGNVRETISYVLFSPDPEKLMNADMADSNLFYLDPYVADASSGRTHARAALAMTKRSGISLKIALPLLRSKLEGVYSSRALHLFLSYPTAASDSPHSGIGTEYPTPEDHMRWMSTHMVPPVKIYLSKDPSSIDPEEFDCADAIRRLNASGPNVGIEEKLLQEQIYNNPACMQQYFEQFKEDTSAASPNLSKKQLESLGEAFSSPPGSVMENQYVKALYTQFFNILDMESMMALIMACLQKKLGLPLTAEAICETAIIKLIENIGPGAVQQAMLANALLSPDSEASKKFLEVQAGAPPFATNSASLAASGVYSEGELEEEALVLDSYYNDAPLATSLAMSKKEPAGVVKIIRELEKSGTHVQLIPGIKSDTEDEISVPYGSLYVVEQTYTEEEIENEKQRLKQLGYTEDEARAMLIFSGYLRPSPQQYEPLLGSDDFSSPLARGLMAGPAADWAPQGVESAIAINQTAQNWLNYMKGVLGLQAICELLVGDVLAGLQDLLKNPGAFLGGGYKGWFENFVDGLKKQFMPPPPVLKFPDKLMTDDHMGGFGEHLIKMMLSLVASMLGQIVSLLIKNALEQCLEEDSDLGPRGQPIVNPIEGMSIPAIERADLPKIGGLSDDEVVAWLKDIVDNVSPSQLCSLLRGDATKQTLKNCLARTKSLWPVVYGSGVDTIYQIRVAFKKLGKEVDLDICDALQSNMPDTLVDNLCDAVFDVDARCEHLKRSGLTEEECQEQIDREIEDLKNNVSGLASLSMFETNPLNNSFPPICGDNGTFVVPPGLRDTMERITDNMLTNVKGSLLLDMNNLKFFSLPPRALMAASDPGELKKSYQMFESVVKNPYRKACISLIGDIENHQRVYSGLDTNLHEIYPITYNKFIHYGNFSTYRAANKKVQLAGLNDEKIAQASTWASEQAHLWANGVVQEKKEQLEVTNDTGGLISVLEKIKEEMQENLDNLLNNKDYYTKYELVTLPLLGKKVKKWQEGSPQWTEDQFIEATVGLWANIEAIDNIINVEIPKEGIWDGSLPPELANAQTSYGATQGFWASTVPSTVGKQISKALEDLHDEANALYEEEFNNVYSDYFEQKKQQFLDEAQYEPKVGSIANSVIEQNFVLSDEEFLKDVKSYSDSKQNIVDFFERTDMTPMHVGMLNDAPGLTHWYPGNPYRDGFLSTIPNTSRDFVDQYFLSLLEQEKGPEFINDKINSEFTKDLKEIYLDKLVITPSEMFATWKNDLSKKGGGLLYKGPDYKAADEPWAHGHGGKLGNTIHNFPGNIRPENHRNFNLRRVWPLETKLKEISTNPFDWYVMLRNFTGCTINPKWGHHREFPPQWLENSSLIDQFDVDNPDSFWGMLSLGDTLDLSSGLLDDTTAHFYDWLRISPGLRRLIPIMAKNIKDDINTVFETPAVFEGGEGHTKWRNLTEVDIDYLSGETLNHNIAFAFMELTLAEALGLENKRIKKIFPNMGDYTTHSLGVILSSDVSYVTATIRAGVASQTADGFMDIVDNSTIRGTMEENTLFAGYHAMYLVYEKTFRDPELPFNKSPEEIIDYFSLSKEKVNKELYDFFDRFPPSMGTVKSATAQANNIYKATKNLESDINFNPNILKYDLPFSEVTSRSVPGVDGEAINQEIVDIFSAVGGAEAAAELASQIQVTKHAKSLINQNISATDGETGYSLKINIDNQLNGIKDVSKFIKAQIVNGLSSTALGAPPVESNDNLTNEIYNFNFSDELETEIRELINGLLPGRVTAKDILDNSILDTNHYTRRTDMPSGFQLPGQVHREAFKFHPLNFKAQIFGEFLTKKFMDKFNEYYDPSVAYDADYVSENYNNFEKRLKYILSGYGYSSLQYAYSTQMFAKLKHSRLHERGFMKKLWKKVLKSPLTSGVGGADPRCAQLLEQISAPSVDDLKDTTTDFFEISEDIKPKIVKFYKKSLCYDVYELSTERENAATVSLIEGMIILIAKIYTLEMFLASIIAWDSFDLSDVFKDKSLISIIIKNISEDFDIEFLSFFANDILRKEKGLTEFELTKLRNQQSSLHYMITREAESISAVIKKMFGNSRPLSTDLQLSITKNSDPQFRPHNPGQEVVDTHANEFLATTGFSKLFNEGNHDYVIDAHLKNNIYTMNYGYPWKRNFGDHSQDNFKDLVTKNSDIYGFNTDHTSTRGNKNYLHSLPMNYYHSKGLTKFSTNYSENNESGHNSWKTSPNFGVKSGKTGYNDFTSYHHKHRQHLGHSDGFSNENAPETTYGNDLNAKLGNIIFQPYVKVEDWSFPDDTDFDFVVNVFSEIDENGNPCDGATLLDTINASDFLDLINEEIHSYRSEHNNVLGCHMYGCVPLSAWSYFYSNIFMRAISIHEPLRSLHEKYGLRPFFKKISFGMRMLYSTSFPVMDSSKVDFPKFMEASFGAGKGTENAIALKNAKSLYGQRPHYITVRPDCTNPDFCPGKGQLLRELQIPIIEVEKELQFPEEAVDSFTVGESDVFSLSELGTYTSETNNMVYDGTEEFIDKLLANNNIANHLLKTTHQFFYKNLANELLSEIKTSPEFKLMFDYLFPMRRYMAMSVVLASDGLSKFIPEPTTILEETKSSLKMITDNLINSGDYKHMPDPIANFLSNLELRKQGGTTGKDVDLTKELLKIILKTPFYILKGFVEITDPAVMTAKTIIDVVNMIAFTTLSTIKQAAAVSKQVVSAGITAARAAMQQLEMQLGMAIAMAGSTVASLPGGMSEAVSITSDGPIEQWVLEINEEKKAEILQVLEPADQKKWEDFEVEFVKLQGLQVDYLAKKDELEGLEEDLRTLEEKLDAPFPPGWPENKEPPPGAITVAEDKLNSVLKSPYLLPGLWAALLPPMLPFGGGIVPPPFPGGPFPSTVPGMIYIALLLIDAIEEKTHDDIQKQKLGSDLNCEDEL